MWVNIKVSCQLAACLALTLPVVSLGWHWSRGVWRRKLAQTVKGSFYPGYVLLLSLFTLLFLLGSSGECLSV